MFSSLNGPSLNFGAHPPAPGVRRRLPRLDAAHPGTVQRLGNAAGDLRAGHRRPGTAARVRGQLAERHVQRRGPDHRRRAVDPAVARRPWGSGSRRAWPGGRRRRGRDRPARAGEPEARRATGARPAGSSSRSAGAEPASRDSADADAITMTHMSQREKERYDAPHATKPPDAAAGRASADVGRDHRHVRPCARACGLRLVELVAARSSALVELERLERGAVGGEFRLRRAGAAKAHGQPVQVDAAPTKITSRRRSSRPRPAARRSSCSATNDPNNVKLQKSLKELAALARLELLAGRATTPPTRRRSTPRSTRRCRSTPTTSPRPASR